MRSKLSWLFRQETRIRFTIDVGYGGGSMEVVLGRHRLNWGWVDSVLSDEVIYRDL